MARATFYNKRLLGHIDDTDFTDYQGIGSDPLYKRYKSVESVVKSRISPQYQSFLACPFYEDGNIFWYVDEWNNTPKKFTELSDSEKKHYSQIKDDTLKHYQKTLRKLNPEEFSILSGALKYINDEFIYCYDEKVVLIAWGMRLDEGKHTSDGKWFKTAVKYDKKKISFDLAGHGKLATTIAGAPYLTMINRNKGHIITTKDIPIIIENDGYRFIGWTPNPIGHEVQDDIIFTAQYVKTDTTALVTEKNEKLVKVIFDAGVNGVLEGESSIEVPKGHVLSAEEIPVIKANKGFVFTQWTPSVNAPIDNDTFFSAEYKQEFVQCLFSAGEHGTLYGNKVINKPLGVAPIVSEIPTIKPNKGYRFTGWNINPLTALTDNKVCVAQYEKKQPWYKRWWLWFTGLFSGKGCLKWLLWLLLLILLLFLLSWLLRSCGGNVVEPSPVIETTDGRVIDNNGPIKGIVGEDGKLPDNNIVAPIVGDDGKEPPIVSNPGAPDIVANRLNIYFENADVNLEQFISNLSKIYSEAECQVIGFDKNVPMIQILIPENMRDAIRENLNAQLPNYEFFIVDESIFTFVGDVSTDTANVGWHLDAIDVEEGWKITKGSPNITVAVVDDGIDATHDILKGRIVNPYNVFTQDNRLSVGQGHGTHVAGLAVGSDKMFDKGISGVAPKCKLMPIQVFDNGMCTFSSVTSGIMYAIHKGSNVINVSIGPNFRGLDILPLPDQDYIAKTQFKNEERVWKRIINVANEHNAIIVFAVGNDNILANIPPENRTNFTVNVAAVDRQIKGTDFTNYGRGSNISAPGKGICSSVPVNEYAVFDGTSMAAPIVSGTVALMKSLNQNISVSEVLHILQATGERVSDYMPPMIQVDDALIALKTGVIPELLDADSNANNGIANPNVGEGGFSGNNPIDGESPVNENPGVTDGNAGGNNPGDSEKTPNQDALNPGNTPNPTNPGDNRGKTDPPTSDSENDGTDYDAIRKLIESYKRKISELEKLLPENK